MSNRAKLFFRDELRSYFLYLVAGVAAIPAGICYAFLASKGLERWWSVTPLIAMGLAMALFAWKYLEQKFNASVVASPTSKTSNTEVIALGFGTMGGLAVAASIVVFCAHTPNQASRESEGPRAWQQLGQATSRDNGNVLMPSHT